jgi:hypothetical protein
MVDVVETAFDIAFQNPIGAELFLLRHTKAYWHASCVLLFFLNPNERGSAVVSAIGCNARACSICIALSYMIGILRGRFLVVPGFGI